MRNKHRRQRNTKKSQNLPQELIIRILLRLPVKSLIRFKCVCKSWLSLISDPHFANSHFELAASCTHRIMFLASEALSIDLDASLKDDSASTEIKLNFLLPQSYFHIEIVGSCRGFLLLDCHPNPYIWNPTTGMYKQIPCSSIASNVEPSFFTYLFGFGYDQSTDDYLVVLASYDPGSADWLTHLELFSLRANTWKEIEGIHLPYMNASDDPRVGVNLNGAIHWLALRHDLNVNLILAFDIRERCVSDIPLPEDVYEEPTYCDLWEVGGFLSLCVMGNDEVDIWVMEEYKVQSSWRKTLVLSLNGIPTQYFAPICFTKSGDIVGTDGSHAGLAKYNKEGQLLEHQSYRDHPHRSHVTMYIESLLSLPGYREQAEEDA